MDSLMTIATKTLQRLDVVHIISEPMVVRVMDDESTPSSALFTVTTGIVLHL